MTRRFKWIYTYGSTDTVCSVRLRPDGIFDKLLKQRLALLPEDFSESDFFWRRMHFGGQILRFPHRVAGQKIKTMRNHLVT